MYLKHPVLLCILFVFLVEFSLIVVFLLLFGFFLEGSFLYNGFIPQAICTKKTKWFWLHGLWYLTPLSTIFQLYRDDQC